MKRKVFSILIALALLLSLSCPAFAVNDPTNDNDDQKQVGEQLIGEQGDDEELDGEKPEGEKPEGEKPEGEKPEGEKPEGEKPEGEKPEGEKSEGEGELSEGLFFGITSKKAGGSAMLFAVAGSEEVTAYKGSAEIDGLADEKYGNPIKTVDGATEGVTANLYLLNDNDYIYYCVVVEGADWSGSRQTEMKVLAGEYAADRGLGAFEYEGCWYERCSRYTLSQNENGEQYSQQEALGLGAAGLAAGTDYVIRYDESTGAMIYELRYPRSAISFAQDQTQFILSSSISLPDGSYVNWYELAGNKKMEAWDGFFEGQNNLGATIHVSNDLPTIDFQNESVTAGYGKAKIDGETDAKYGQSIRKLTAVGTSNATADVYLLNDNDYVYYCAVVKGYDWSQSQETSIKLLAGEYAADRGLGAFEYDGCWYERCSRYTVTQAGDGTQNASGDSLGLDQQQLSASDYIIRYDEATGTMTYEIRYPRSAISFVQDPSRFVMSSMIQLPDGSNISWFNTAKNKKMEPWDGFFEGQNNNGATVAVEGYAFGPETASETVSVDFNTPVIDGARDTEYGDGKTTITTKDNANVSADIYLLNDDSYVYFCAVVSGVDFSEDDTTRINLLAGEYIENRGLGAFEQDGIWYERCSRFTASLDAAGNQNAAGDSLGIAAPALDSGTDYVIKYDPAQRTLTYEVRYPRSSVSFQYSSDHFVLSSSIELPDGSILNWHNTALDKKMEAWDGFFEGQNHLGATIILKGLAGEDNQGNNENNEGNNTPLEFERVTAGTVMPDEITIDAKIESAYGESVKEIEGENGSMSVFLCRDLNYLYVAAVISGVDWSEDPSCTFKVLAGEYTPFRGLGAFEWEGCWYERCSRYTLSMLKNGSVKSAWDQAGIGEMPDLKSGIGNDYYMAVDEETGNMVIEMRYPMSTISFAQSDKSLVLSVSATLPNGDVLSWYDLAEDKLMEPWDGFFEGQNHIGAVVDLA